jgi:hypothetical protein
MPARRRSPFVLLVLLGLLVPTRAGAVEITPGEARALIESRLAPAREKVAALRSALAEGGLTAAVRAGAIAAGREGQVNVPAVGAGPATLVQAVASIAAVVQRADATVKQGPAAELPAWAADVAQEIAVTGATDPRAAHGLQPVDSAPALNAAATIAAAVDGAMPALQSSGATLSASSADVECDVLDLTNICVGGLGDNTYTRDRQVTIDLGGNDTYLYDAGYVSPGAELVLDVSGNDRYVNEYGDGYGVVGGVGVLVDATGNDLYQMHSTKAEVAGMGLGILGGAGFMVDGAGDDVYSMSSEVTGASAGAGGMGEGVLGGVGVMVDGAGNDTYTARGIAHPKLGMAFGEEGEELGEATILGRAAVSVGGIGVFGAAGVLADSGGTDGFTASSRITAAPPEWPDVHLTHDDFSVEQFAVVNGLGDASLAGAGYLLEGPGATTYSLESDIESVPLDDPAMYMSSLAQGDSAAASIGVLSDAGGDDTYSLDLSANSTVARSVTDACADPCALPNAVAIAPPVTATGQGYGLTGALGLLEDAAGNDTYRVRLNQSATSIVRDERTQPAASVLSGRASVSGPTYAGQAAGVGAGTGSVVDSQGNDKYETTITASAEVRSHAALPANEPDVSVGSGKAKALVQGAAGTIGAAGGLIDIGGYDAYSASVSSQAVINGGEPVPGTVVVDAQAAVEDTGSSLALALDLDGVLDDTYSTTPPTPACQGIRGQAVWQDCGRVGIGVNA